MAGQYLLDERRAGSRQAHDEDRDFAFQPEATDPLEEIRRADCNHLGDKKFALFRIVRLAALAPRGQLQSVAPIQVLGGFSILAPRVQDLGQAEVQEQSLCVRQRRLRQQLTLRRQILRRKFAAQEFRQFVMREGEPGIVPQSGAEAVFRTPKIAYLLQSAAQVAVCLGIIWLQFQCPTVAGDRFVQLPLVVVSPVVVANPPACVPTNTRIVNPATTGTTLSYTLNGQQFGLQPGSMEQVGTASVVEFDWGNGLGIARYTLDGGTYTCTAGSNGGWDLVHTLG